MKKHAEKKIQCPVQDCECSLYRMDKLRYHLKQSHTTDETCLCPVLACKAGPYPWGLLGVHLSEDSERHKRSGLQAFYMGLGGERCCPVNACEQWVPIHRVQEHIRSHNVRERRESEDDIRKAGFDVNGHIVCPICGKVETLIREFERHLEDHHLVTDAAHLRRLQAQIQSELADESRLPAWEAWPTNFLQTRQNTCGSCYQPVEYHSNNVIHHLGLLKDPVQLRPFRQQILELLGPIFSTHPVFDDIRAK
jgi:hypothetical protein